MSEEKVNQGLFLANLTRDFKQLKRDRAESVAEDAEIAYKRHIEDICRALRENKRKTENLMLELAPTTSFDATVVPANFDVNKFMEADEKLGLETRNLSIRLEIMLDRYETLFGEFTDTELVTKVLPTWKSKYNAE
jgi:hypothetical protein